MPTHFMDMLLDNHRVFVAYQPDVYAEASAIMEVIDVQQSKTYSLGEIGGTGESNFDINPETKKLFLMTQTALS